MAKWLERKKTQDAMIIGLENNLKANEEPRKIILGAEPDINEEEVILVLGEEVKGIPTEIRKLCDCFLEIPMRGQKESFNVSIAAAIALWKLSLRA